MNKVECEQQIKEKLLEIKDIYTQYNPKGDYLTLTVFDDSLHFWNKYYDEEGPDAENPINYWEFFGEEDNEDE